MLKKSKAYATCRWNHCDSSKGSHLNFGLTHLKRVLHIGSKIRVPSAASAKPAPRDIQTEKVSLLSGANRESVICFHLKWPSAQAYKHQEISFVPAKGKQSRVKSVKKDVKYNLRRAEVRLPL